MLFHYIAFDKSTKKNIRGQQEASHTNDLITKLNAKNLVLVEIIKGNQWLDSIKNSFASKPATEKEIMIFTRQLGATLSSGLTLTECLDVISEEMENINFKNIIINIRKSIEGGADFSTSLNKHPHVFNKTFVAIVRSGEISGSLHQTLSNLAKYLEDSADFKDKVTTALRYPIFVFGFAIFIVLVMVLFLIPKFADMFNKSAGQLPLLTRIVVGTSDWFIKNIVAVVIVVTAAIIGLRIALEKPNVKFYYENLLIKIPLFGKGILHKSILARFCETFGFLLSCGVSLSDTLEITSQIIGHEPTAKAIQEIKKNVVSGGLLHQEMRKQKVMTPLVCKMTFVGERTGKLNEMLRRTSEYYQGEVNHTLNRLASILEPALIVFIGSIVLVIVLALYLPIFQMSTTLK